MNEPNGDPQGNVDPKADPQGNGTIITAKFRGEDKKFDISAPEQLTTVQSLSSKGSEYDFTVSNKLPDLEKKAQEYDNFENLLRKSRTDEATRSELIAFFEQQIGQPLTR